MHFQIASLPNYLHSKLLRFQSSCDLASTFVHTWCWVFHVLYHFFHSKSCWSSVSFGSLHGNSRAVIMSLLLLILTVLLIAQHGVSWAATPRPPAGELQGTRDSLIQHYFWEGYTYRLILYFPYFIHGISLSLRQLKRILRRQGLRRRSTRYCISHEGGSY